MVAARLFFPLLLIGFVLHSTDVPARTWHITPDGLGDAATIKAGIDSATAGDTVLVSCGIYYESGIDMRSGVVLLGETAEGDSAVIDAQERFNVFNCSGCDSGTLIEGLTIRNGKREDWYPTDGGARSQFHRRAGRGYLAA